jgi:hypothetical protein
VKPLDSTTRAGLAFWCTVALTVGCFGGKDPPQDLGADLGADLGPDLDAAGDGGWADACVGGTKALVNGGCCSLGCGESGNDDRSLMKCSGGSWACEGQLEVPAQRCASYPKPNICVWQPCAGGSGEEEPDPVRELCCVGGCGGSVVKRRICKTGRYKCEGADPISNCVNYLAACGGAIQKYRDNGYKSTEF